MKTKKNLVLRNGVYYLVHMENGKRTSRSLKTGNEKDAIDARNKILKPALAATSIEHVNLNIAEARKMLVNVQHPLDEIWKQYKKSSRRPDSSDGTLGNYERCLDMFLQWLESDHKEVKSINQISKNIAEEYAEHLWEREVSKAVMKDGKLVKKAKKISANTYNYHIQALNLIFKIVCNAVETPFSGVQRKKEDKIGRNNFTEIQLKQIFAVFKDPEFTVDNKQELEILCYVGAYTGTRLVDAVSLSWEQIDFINRMITAKPIKTRNIQRTVGIPIHTDFLKFLNSLDKRAGGYLMPQLYERYDKNPDGIVDAFYKVLDFVNLTAMKEGARGKSRRLYSFHSFRHTFASFAANSGVPLTTLAAILGDNPRTLERYYIKASDEVKMKAVNSIPSLMISEHAESDIVEGEIVETASLLGEHIKKAISLLEKAKDREISDKLRDKLVKALKS